MSVTTDSEISMNMGGSTDTGFHPQVPRNPTGHSMTSLQKISLAITGTMEKFFFRWGVTVGTHPKKAILSCLLLTLLCGIGLLNFSMENRPDRLWIPRHSEFAENTAWLRSSFPSPVRTSFAIIKADNVMTPEVMRVILEIHEKVKGIRLQSGQGWEDICYKLPVTKFLRRRRRSTASNNSFDAAFDDPFFQEDLAGGTADSFGFAELFQVPDEFYCSVVEELEKACWEVNPAEMWSFEPNAIQNLTREEVIRVLNHELTSPIFGREVNYTVDFGGKVERNDKGEIISATALQLRWIVAINQTKLERGEVVTDKTGEVADADCFEWELKWIEVMKNMSKSGAVPEGVEVHFVNQQSWLEISEATIFDDGITLAVGFVVMFCYVGTMLGRFNLVEQRPFLTMAGLSCVGLSCLVSYGVCSLFSIVYGPVNKILPFLLLGIGIDDMFVIMQCWNNLFPPNFTNKNSLPLPTRMGMALKHAGVSITVTSLTDVAAFAVGASTILPGLQSFCIYAAVGIVAIFIFQATYFVAFFTLDQRRVEERRNAFLPWIKYDETAFLPNSKTSQSFGSTFFDKIVSKFLFTKGAKAGVILLTFTFLGVNIYGNTLLRQEFDPMWFIPEDSYMSKFVREREVNYPGTGYPAFIVASGVNWSHSLPQFDHVLKELEGSGVAYKLENWYEEFREYANSNFGTDLPLEELSPTLFQKYMGKFLYSPGGSKYRAFFKVDGNFTCGSSLPPIKTALLPFRFKKFKGPEEHIPELRGVKSLLKHSNISFNQGGGKFFVWGTGLVTWEADEIIDEELYRNVALSLLCVLVTTFLLLANLRVCLLCGLCVVFTLINVGGLMHFWGLTIDTVSCINIVLGIGLCVDYAAHIALAFMTCTGSREGRAKQALKSIGPAVLNGGFSTFLAIVLLANSKSHAFQTFFKIFTIVIVFGLFHGLIFLPVLLSIFGPDPYPFAYSREDDFPPDSPPSPHQGKNPKVVEMKALRVEEFVEKQNKIMKDTTGGEEGMRISEPLLLPTLMSDLIIEGHGKTKQ